VSTTDQEFAPSSVLPPYFDTTDPDNPAAGVNATVKVPGEAWVAVLAARCSLTTSATVANRFVSLDYIDARGITRVRNAAALVVAASTTGLAFEWNAGRTMAEWASNTPVLAPCLDMWLEPGGSFQITVDNIQAADQLSAVHFALLKRETGPDRVAYGGGPVRFR
jgi:hypothetical protein